MDHASMAIEVESGDIYSFYLEESKKECFRKESEAFAYACNVASLCLQ